MKKCLQGQARSKGQPTTAFQMDGHAKGVLTTTVVQECVYVNVVLPESAYRGIKARATSVVLSLPIGVNMLLIFCYIYFQ